MKKMTEQTQSKKTTSEAHAGGQAAPAGTACPLARGGRDLSDFSPPDPEVTEKKRHRKFTAKYKIQIPDAVDDCSEPGQIGALLRREGLYSSHLTRWRSQREKGVLKATEPNKRGCRGKEKNPLAKELTRLEHENRVLKEKLRKAEIIIDVQKKISDLMTLSQNLSHNGGNS